ncbi:hypothetical protein [Siphonobacter curvatus]|uniref:hypothetical protein n=1 Tax=Siphonobacter curvatus TaxID=2094562 RepID=UPI0013FE3D9D|nr:hypothetical protein [Siphonobacter curvatus]
MQSLQPEIIGLISAIIGAIGGFIGGIQYQKSKTNQKDITLNAGNNSNQNIAGRDIRGK